MDITWYGLSCFRINERGRATVVTDPYNGNMGLPALKLKADIVTISHDAAGHNHAEAVQGHSHVIEGPGEYEIGGVFVTGTATREKIGATRNVLYLLDFEGLRVAHLGDIVELPTQSQIEELGEVNILLLPVGGGKSLNAVQAAELVSMFEPNIVIPMHYKTPQLTVALEDVDRFLNEMGQTDVEETSSLRVTATSLPEETQTVILTPKYL
jgi:L-ascorbate metabolism protein UlaG (beta-lactamase superfamily)